MIASLSNILPTGFAGHFVGNSLEKVRDRWMGSCCFLYFLKFDKKKFKERDAVVKALGRSIQDTTCNTSIDDTVQFVYGHTEVLMETSSGTCITENKS